MLSRLISDLGGFMILYLIIVYLIGLILAVLGVGNHYNEGSY